jgi:YfiH family protein
VAPGNAETTRRYPLRVPDWDDVPGLVHAFLGREQSLPPGPFALDDLRRALREAGEEPPLVLAARQVHGAGILGPEHFGPDIASPGGAPVLPSVLPAGDALVSASADTVLTVRTADCVPIILVAPRARAAAAVHAGWRGLLAGVIEGAVAALEARYGARASEVRAAIGPAIGACCYEFGAEHRSAFVARLGEAAARAWRVPDPGRGTREHLDLRLLCRLALASAGLEEEAISEVGPCTADHPAELHSYRRDGEHAGRQLSYVGWRA